ncbi:helix-turn-helix domain-containing protein [Microbulbifer sp. HZ11]|uniref:helix-turn-helix domain-containing protein n=1 Tax=Microbulbifer sp. HZ11 TaxID=1453501 RepID=UPI0005BE003F|nr:helix-turn-helix transcriptional regulator [Microbulbifer sp. HZ11]
MKRNLKQQFGQRLTVLRKARGISQEDLAFLLDVSVETVSHIERGIHGPRFDLLEDIARTLGVEPRELFDFQKD